MGLFDFLKKHDPNTLTQEESISSKLFLKLIVRAGREDRRNFEEEIKQLSARMYEHSFKRAGLTLIPLARITDAIAVATEPKLIGCLGFFSSIKEGLDTICDSYENLNTNSMNQAGADTSMLQLLQMYSTQLKKFIRN